MGDKKYMYLIIRLPNSRVLILLTRAMLLGLLVVSFPWIGSIVGGSSTSSPPINPNRAMINLEILPLLFRDLTNEGLLKIGEKEKVIFISNGNEEAIHRSSQIILKEIEIEMDFISVTDLEKQSSIPSETFDFAMASNFPAAVDFIDRTLKIGGIVVVELSENPFAAFHKPSNYKIVYLRRFGSAVMAMKKTGPVERRVSGYAPEAKKAALENLEDVLLEPPRAGSGKSSRYLKRTRYLPDLMGDSLESYPRRVFIDVGLPEKEGGSGTGWFAKHYPTRNKDFEMYKIETVTDGKEVPQIGMSDWLRRNVKDEEYVVMKAETEVVEEMVKSKAIGLVDELFLECKPQGHGGRKKGNNNNYGGRRAYWECLALYGRLRDEGVAVHQWWG
ncbi:uncharacterized protein LOC132190162 [Corylus avellana]|uniref:uncharacterized protein LOC132190162 n=1 Tax=Corylus avellana TaxID=13451 RepID=UPI00286B6AB7|nr:uncharacterized protein LOC132190162 [Corylus avellana]